MKPLSTAYTQAVNSWLRLHTGRVVTLAQVPQLFNEAFVRTATAKTAINGFRKCGIYPVDRNIFQDYEFSPSVPTDQPITSAPQPLQAGHSPSATSLALVRYTPPLLLLLGQNAIDRIWRSLQGIDFNALPNTFLRKPCKERISHSLSREYQSPFQLRPLTPAVKRKTTARKRGHPVVLKGSPYKKQLVEEQTPKKKSTARKPRQKRKPTQKGSWSRNGKIKTIRVIAYVSIAMSPMPREDGSDVTTV